MPDLDEILIDRAKLYGDFTGHAALTQALKQLIHHRATSRKLWLEPFQKEALDMICHKIGRIINGDPNYTDSWDDIAGYATLVANRLRKP